LRLRNTSGTIARLTWKTDNNVSGNITFSVMNDGFFHEYEIPVYKNKQWQGRIKEITDLSINSQKNTAWEFDYIRIVSLGARIEIQSFRAFRSIFQQGRSFPLLAILKNRGDKLSKPLSISLQIPSDLHVVTGKPNTQIELAADEQDTLQWTLIPNATGHFRMDLVLEMQNKSPITKSFEIDVQLKSYKLSRFMMTSWGGPALNDSAYADYAKSNFTTVMASSEDQSVHLAEKYGLDLLVGQLYIADSTTVVDKLKTHADVVGYFITDEPSPPSFPGLRLVVDFLRKRDPEKLGMINLIGTHETNEIDLAKYYDYLNQFMDIVRPELLCYDYYPFNKDTDEPSYFNSLAIIRHWATRYDVPFGYIFQGAALIEPEWNIYLRTPDESELRWQVYSAIAYGAKALMYFSWGRVLISPKRDELLAAITKLNGEIKALGPILIKLSSVGVYHSLRLPAGNWNSLLPPNGLVRKVSDNADMVVGEFIDDLRNKYCMLMNKDHAQGVSATVTLNSSVSDVKAFDTDKGAWIVVPCKYSPGETEFSYSFLPGSGILFVIGQETKVAHGQSDRLPERYFLEQNYPNPFNDATVISYHLSHAVAVRLSVLNVLGQEVAVLVNMVQQPGHHQIKYSASDRSSGIYFCKFETGKTVQYRKWILMR
jgi:hypothetical protein